jgi:hypothetical protein
MKRAELINILNKHIPSDWKVSDKIDKGVETSSIYIGKYSKRLGSYITQLKCITYFGSTAMRGVSPYKKIIWYFHLYVDNETKEFLIPNETADDFIEIFMDRYTKYLDIKKDIDRVYNSIFILSNSNKLKEEIREYKINKVIKSENQE